jgi:hypothetical protein
MTTNEDLKAWVKKEYKLTDNSSRDIVSRLKRASSYIDIDLDMSDEELLFQMNNSDGFGDLGTTIKSQLRRALKCYRAYKRNNKNTLSDNSLESDHQKKKKAKR